MKFIQKYIAFTFLLFVASSLKAQEKLTLEDAVKIALENNYDIKLSKNTAQISTNNLNYGKTALLPNAQGNFSNSQRIETSEVQRTDGDTRKADNAKTSNLNYGVALNWLVFDGFSMFANYHQLEEFEKLGKLNTKITIQNTLSEVISIYYDLVAQKQQLHATNTALEVSLVRLKNAKSRYSIGRGSKLELLAAKVDLNTDTTQLLRQQDIIKAGKVRLNEVLARDLNLPFEVSDAIAIDNELLFEDLKTKAAQQNPALQTAIINQKVANLQLKAIKGGRYPDIYLTSGYNFSQTKSPPIGFSTQSNTRGLNYGITASLNIFNGFLQNKAEKNARLAIDNTQIELQQTTKNIDAQLINSYQNYQTNLQLVKLEAANVAVAEENLNITLEKYRLGSIVPLELREAQRNYIDATARYANSQYLAKMAEIALKEIAGSISL